MGENSSAVLRMRAVPIRLYEVRPATADREAEIVEKDDQPILVEVGVVLTANTLAAIEERFDTPVRRYLRGDDGLPVVIDGAMVEYQAVGIDAWMEALNTYTGMRRTLSIVLGDRDEIECGLAMIPAESQVYRRAFLAAYGIANGMDPAEGKVTLEAFRTAEIQRLQAISDEVQETLREIGDQPNVPDAQPAARKNSSPDTNGVSSTGSGAGQDSPTKSSGA